MKSEPRETIDESTVGFTFSASGTRESWLEQVVFHSRPLLRAPVLVLAFSGWNDAGQAATTAVRYLAEQFNAAKLATIEPEEFYDFTVQRPLVHLTPEATRMVDWVSVECFAAPVAVSERDYVFGWGPEPHLKWKTFCATILDLARACQAQMVVTLGGFLAEVLYSEPVPVSGFASSAELLAQLDVGTTRYEGPTGIVGVLGDACRAAGVAHASLWAALPHYIAAVPNPRGALALLLRLSGFLRLPLDLTGLQKAAADFEQNVEEAVAKDAKLSAYVRELKRRQRAN